MMNGMEAQFSIKAASKRAGLTTHTIRAWERRYGILSPVRSETNRRLFSVEDVERLTLLRQATEQGHSIGNVARLSNQELLSLGLPAVAPTNRSLLDRCIDAVTRLDSQALYQLLVSQTNEAGLNHTVDEIIVPLLRLSGTRWEDGSWTVAHEHLVAACVRSFVENARSRIQPLPSAPRIVVCTLADQMHEIGALLVALSASMCGWHVAYLGANMPARDIGSAAVSFCADVVAVSVSLPLSADSATRELVKLRQSMGSKVRVIVGGQGAAILAQGLSDAQAEAVPSLKDLRAILSGS